MPLLSLLPLLGISLTLQRRFETASALSLMLAVALWLALAFVAGLAGLLRPVAIAIWGAGALLLAVQLPWWLRRMRQHGPDIVFALFVLFCVAFWFVHHDSQYFYYDEYSHWGVFLKDMWALDGFWQADSNSLHDRYPPAAPLWQYAFTVFAPKTDASAYMAQFVLLVAPLMVLFEGLSWRRPLWLAAITLAAVAGLANFGHGVASLYVDHLVSTWFAGTLLAFMLLRRPGLARVAVLALPLFVLSLLKDAGVAFALSAAAIIGAVLLVDRWRADGGARALATAALAVVLVVAPSFVALGAWSANRDAAGVARETQSLSGVVRGVLQGERALDDGASAEISARYRKVFLHQQLAKDDVSAQFNAFSYPLMHLFEDRLRVSTAQFYLLFALFFVVLLGVARPPGRTARWSVFAAGVLGTALAYSLVLYLSYLFAFGERGLQLSSYIRYTHSAALALLLVAIAAVTPAHGLLGGVRRTGRFAIPLGGATMAALLAWLYVAETPHLATIIERNPRLEPRIAAEPLMRDIRSAVGERRLWVYYPADRPNGFLGELIQFQLAPTPTTIERDPAFFDQPADALTEALSGYDVLWFPMPDAGTDRRVADVLGVTLQGRFVEPHRRENGSTGFRLYEFANADGTNAGDH